jgi:hypothetical protein
MILVKFWFWSFLVFLDAASVRQTPEFEKSEFAQVFTGGNRDNGD